ncbi:MAG: sulfite exporter TauE/SafE family protein [Thermoanaerobaculia bacterium]
MPLHLVIGAILAALVGVSLGLLGGGGSIITVPLLVYVLGVEPHASVGMSLAVVGITSLIGAIVHFRRGTVDGRTGALFAGSGMVAAYFGSRLTRLFSDQGLMLTFAGLMIVIGVLMLFRRGTADTEETTKKSSAWKALLAGVGVGVLTGALGVGGGFLIVPALVFFGGLGMRQAVGTSLVVIAINCAAGFAGHFGAEGLDLGITALVAGPAAAGTIVGARLANTISPSSLRKSFAVFVILVAFYLIWKNV